MGVLPICRGAVSVFYSPSQLGKDLLMMEKQKQVLKLYENDVNKFKLKNWQITQLEHNQVTIIFTETFWQTSQQKNKNKKKKTTWFFLWVSKSFSFWRPNWPIWFIFSYKIRQRPINFLAFLLTMIFFSISSWVWHSFSIFIFFEYGIHFFIHFFWV